MSGRSATAVDISLGQLRLGRDEIRKLKDGSVIELEAGVGDGVRIVADGRVVAEGVLLLDGGELVVRVLRLC